MDTSTFIHEVRLEGLTKQHLKGPEGQVEEYFIILCDGLTERNEDHIVDAEQRDQQEGGFGQPSERETVMNTYLKLRTTVTDVIAVK